MVYLAGPMDTSEFISGLVCRTVVCQSQGSSTKTNLCMQWELAQRLGLKDHPRQSLNLEEKATLRFSEKLLLLWFGCFFFRDRRIACKRYRIVLVNVK